MKTLFALPLSKRIEPTLAQLQLLDLVAMYETQPLTEQLRRYRFSRKVLRRVLEDKLVACVALGPARYMLTPVGRIVRGRNGYQRRRSPRQTELE